MKLSKIKGDWLMETSETDTNGLEDDVIQSTPPQHQRGGQASYDEAQNLHNKLIVIQAVNYKQHGYTDIKVNHAGFQQRQPAAVDGYTPDLSAVLDSQITICEVETHDSIGELRTVDKWKAFDNSGCHFHLIIPTEDFNKVKDITKCNGISVDKYWCIKDY
jgi:hypothetical protein